MKKTYKYALQFLLWSTLAISLVLIIIKFLDAKSVYDYSIKTKINSLSDITTFEPSADIKDTTEISMGYAKINLRSDYIQNISAPSEGFVILIEGKDMSIMIVRALPTDPQNLTKYFRNSYKEIFFQEKDSFSKISKNIKRTDNEDVAMSLQGNFEWHKFLLGTKKKSLTILALSTISQNELYLELLQLRTITLKGYDKYALFQNKNINAILYYDSITSPNNASADIYSNDNKLAQHIKVHSETKKKSLAILKEVLSKFEYLNTGFTEIEIKKHHVKEVERINNLK